LRKSRHVPDVSGGSQSDPESMFRTGSGLIDAEHAFTVARRAGRRAALVGTLRRNRGGRRLEVLCRVRAGRSGALGAIREVPLDEISGTLEPSRAAQFDSAFRPIAGSARKRWERIWLAEDRGQRLPPISLVRIGDRYAVLDGHHRVSVARARGALSIDATVDVA
jgi:hypothetical protein